MKVEIDTPQQLWRTATNTQNESNRIVGEGEGDARAWRAAFNSQATDDMMDDVAAYAAFRARLHWGGRRDAGYYEELGMDALGDTFAGIVTWDPARCPLALHLKSVIRSRLSHQIERDEACQHVDIDDISEEAVSTAMERTTPRTSAAELASFGTEFVARLRVVAGADEPVLRLIDLYMNGVTERRDVCRIGGMTARTYHNAHRRLKRMVENLPENLRTAAIGAMA
ncbi:MAG: hypothetical protein WKG01_11255 [Kofleriaceae bacterium]